jgi:apolipoprotein N-acyltransferase
MALDDAGQKLLVPFGQGVPSRGRDTEALLAQYVLRRQKKDVSAADYTIPETVRLTPPPCWKDLSPEAYRKRIADLIE